MTRINQISSNDYSETYEIDGITVRAARAYWHDDTEAAVTLYDADGEEIAHGDFEMAPDGYDPDTHEGPEAHTDWEAYEKFVLDLFDDYQDDRVREGICSRIREAREEAKLTQKQLADKLGVKQQNLTRWETNRVPEVTTLMKIAKATGVQIGFLLGYFPRLPTSWNPMIVIPTTDDTPQTAEEAKRLLEAYTGDEEELEDIEENLAEGWLEWFDGALVSWIDGEKDEKQTRRFLMYVR